MTKSLLWKEWREQRWKLAFGTALLCGFCMIAISSRIITDRSVIMLLLLLGTGIYPLMVTTSVIAGERETGTLPFLMGLPVRPWRILLVKGMITLMVAVLPFSLAMGYTIFATRNHAIELPWIGGMGIWVAGSIVAWTVSIGVRQPSEARVGAMGIGTIFLWGLFAQILEEWRPTGETQLWRHMATEVMLCLDPLQVVSLAGRVGVAPWRWKVFILLQGLILVLLWIRALRGLSKWKGARS